MTPQELEDLYLEVLHQVEMRYQFITADNLLGPPDTDQIRASAEDALNEINSAPPQTFFGLDVVMLGADTRWKAPLYVSTAKNLLGLLYVRWVNSGFDATVNEIEVKNKMDDYKAAMEALNDDFQARIEKLKGTSQKFIRNVPPSAMSRLYGKNQLLSIPGRFVRLR